MTARWRPAWWYAWKEVGAVGERDGVKLEQQVLLVEDGYEILSTYPLEEALLD